MLYSNSNRWTFFIKSARSVLGRARGSWWARAGEALPSHNLQDHDQAICTRNPRPIHTMSPPRYIGILTHPKTKLGACGWASASGGLGGIYHSRCPLPVLPTCRPASQPESRQRRDLSPQPSPPNCGVLLANLVCRWNVTATVDVCSHLCRRSVHVRNVGPR